MNDFSRHAHRQWYVAAMSNDLLQAPRPVLVLGSTLVLGRLPSGEILALEDRCPHRGVPLSDGRLGSMGIACRLHGWTFNATGQCVRIPGAGDAEQYADIRVAAYSVTERDGLVWVALSPAAPFPARVNAMDPAARRQLWQARWRAPSIDAQEYFIDAMHAELARAGTVRNDSKRRSASALLQGSGDGFSIDYSARTRQGSLLLRLLGSVRAGARTYFSGLSVTQLEYRDARGWRAWLTVCFTPETLVSTHLYASLHVQGRRVPTWLARAAIAPFLRIAAGHQPRLAFSADRADASLGELRLAIGRSGARPYLEEAWQGPERRLPGWADITGIASDEV